MDVIPNPLSGGAEVFINAEGLLIVVFKDRFDTFNFGEGEEAFGGVDFVGFHDAEEMVREKFPEGEPPL